MNLSGTGGQDPASFRDSRNDQDRSGKFSYLMLLIRDRQTDWMAHRPPLCITIGWETRTKLGCCRPVAKATLRDCSVAQRRSYMSECQGVEEARRFTFGRPSIQTNRSQRRSPDTSEWRAEPDILYPYTLQ